MSVTPTPTQTPRLLARVLVTFLPPLLVAAVLGWLLLRPVATPMLLLSPSQDYSSACTPTDFRVGYRTSPRSALLEEDGGYTMLGRSWLSAQVCGPGTLTITAQGQVAGGQAPTLAISVEGHTLAHESFAEQRTVTVPVPRSGHLTLAYLNDFYQSEARTASLHQMQFLGKSCNTFEISMPTDSGAWVPNHQQLLMPTTGAVTLTPCGSGTLQFQAQGRAAAGEFPALKVTQAEKTQQVTLGATRQLVRLEVTSTEPLTLEIANPYFAELADRNLYIEKLEFTPAL